eukprot:5898720-Amphidinium_carterae.1
MMDSRFSILEEEMKSTNQSSIILQLSGIKTVEVSETCIGSEMQQSKVKRSHTNSSTSKSNQLPLQLPSTEVI